MKTFLDSAVKAAGAAAGIGAALLCAAAAMLAADWAVDVANRR